MDALEMDTADCSNGHSESKVGARHNASTVEARHSESKAGVRHSESERASSQIYWLLFCLCRCGFSHVLRKTDADFLFSITATANFHKHVHSPVFCLFVLIIMIIKRISRAPLYHTRWEHRALYNNTNDRHRHAHTHVPDEGIGTAVKNSLEIIIKQVCLEGGFKTGGRISACSHKANS